VASLPREGYNDLCRRLRIVSLSVERMRLRPHIFQAEAELGWLGWEQVEFYDSEVAAQVAKIQEFERTQASLQNTSAEISVKKAALDEELAQENARHDTALAALAAERAPLAEQLPQAEAARRQKLESTERFQRAVNEISALEKRLEADSHSFMNVENPTIAIRNEARRVSDEIVQLGMERKHVLADKAAAVLEAEALETTIAHLRAELQRIDAASDAARDSLAAATRRVSAEMRLLDREKEKSSLEMAHLDKEKQLPYRFIGACLATHGIAPRNQPEILEKAVTLRDRDQQLAEALNDLWAVCSATDPAILISFYFLILTLVFVLCAVVVHLV